MIWPRCHVRAQTHAEECNSCQISIPDVENCSHMFVAFLGHNVREYNWHRDRPTYHCRRMLSRGGQPSAVIRGVINPLKHGLYHTYHLL
jgi:hypothetical protein